MFSFIVDSFGEEIIIWNNRRMKGNITRECIRSLRDLRIILEFRVQVQGMFYEWRKNILNLYKKKKPQLVLKSNFENKTFTFIIDFYKLYGRANGLWTLPKLSY